MCVYVCVCVCVCALRDHVCRIGQKHMYTLIICILNKPTVINTYIYIYINLRYTYAVFFAGISSNVRRYTAHLCRSGHPTLDNVLVVGVITVSNAATGCAGVCLDGMRE